MLEIFAENIMDFMVSPSQEKKEEIKKLYTEIKESKNIDKDRLKSVEKVYGYVEWVLCS